MKKLTIAVVLGTTIVASMATGAYGATKLQEIKAYLNKDIAFKVDGKPVQLRDGNNNTVVPISYKGTTYLPVRSISDALGVAVDYDSKTQMIQLGEKVEGVSISSSLTTNTYRTKDSSQTTYNGKDYKEAIFDNADSARSSSFILEPKKKYQKLYLQIAAVGQDLGKLTVKDTETDTILKATEINVADGLVTVEVDIGGANQLFVYADAKGDGAVFVPLTTSYYK
ncbi:Copper amine oxidase N-terminal domain-containing protein [Paenibacillus algorifonticola]|uniref:Copper amine oxidase N-terminal domain-containing protein n=1 Tax=Paenibacillus algorifonticola TaxID=684063 RepID=A0A1I2F9A7_9BACL|nr:stalk domain-containing protein [Paenibacillus algorifonticola]SFF01146.1 Copper amine oxidase N-terminal domain-containing protein [Paenibacillus algorifonticola]